MGFGATFTVNGWEAPEPFFGLFKVSGFGLGNGEGEPVTVTFVVHVETFPFTSVAFQVIVVTPTFNFSLFTDPLSNGSEVAPLKL